MPEFDVDVDGRTVHVHDSGPDDGFPVFWHHGTPGTGATPPPLTRPDLRLLSHDRPGYGGSTRHVGRDIASVAADVAAIADAVGVDRFAVLGASGGGPHSLACAALLPDRVLGVVAVASPAPYDADGLDWFAGMVPGAAAELRAAVAGPDAMREFLASEQFDPDVFTPADHAALQGPWQWLGGDAGAALNAGPDGMIDDDLGYIAPWGFEPADIEAPVLFLHGELDRMVPVAHGRWLAQRCPHATIRTFPNDGHVSVLTHSDVALDWLGELGSR